MSLLIQAASYVGDYAVGDTVRIKFNSTDVTGALAAITTPTVKVYKDDGTAESTAGITLAEGFDSRTGLYAVTIDTTADGTFYSKGSEFEIVLTAGTIGAVSVVGTIVGHFSIANRTLADGKSHGGGTANLNFQQVSLSNAGGAALQIQSTNSSAVAISSTGADTVIIGCNSGNGMALDLYSSGTEPCVSLYGSSSGVGLAIYGPTVTPGPAVLISTNSGNDNSSVGGDAIRFETTSGHAANFVADGTSKHGILSTGGTGGTSDGVKFVAGTGGVALRADTASFLTTALTEAYAADGAAFTPAQALFMIWSAIAEIAISSTTMTCKKLDGSTTSMTFTLDSATAPTSRTRAT